MSKDRSELSATTVLLVVTLIWGTTFPATKFCLNFLPSFLYVGIRFFTASMVILLLYFKRVLRTKRASISAGLILGFLNFGAFVFQTVGIKYTSASNAAFITGLSVVLVYILDCFLHRKPPTVHLTAVIILSIVGTGLVSLTNILEFNIGDFLVFVYSMIYAFQTILIWNYSRKYEIIALTFWEILITAVPAAAVSFAFESLMLHVPLTIFGVVFYLATVATSLALILQNYGQRFVSPTRAALIFTMEPVFAAFFAFVFLGEALTIRKIIGYALILSAMLLSVFRQNEKQCK